MSVRTAGLILPGNETRHAESPAMTLGAITMLSRMLEAEATDAAEGALAYGLMDHAEVKHRFVCDFLATHGPTRGGEVLDVGTGPARIPILLCRLDSRARVVGVDLSRAMIQRAARDVVDAGLNGRIRLQHGDAKALPFGNASFEAVLCDATIHQFPDPMEVVSELVRLTGPGGTLMIRDLCRPENETTLEKLVDRYGGGAPEAARSDFAASFRAALTLAEVREIAELAGLPREGVTMTTDRHWTWIYRRRA